MLWYTPMSLDPEFNFEIDVGMTIEVTHTHEQPCNDPTAGFETVEQTDRGVVTAIPSRKFDWKQDDFDFDYQIEMNGSTGATRSVDLAAEKVCQLHYDAGGDRDWESFNLKSVTVTDSN